MRILLISTAYNGLCQRAHVELNDRGHEVSIALALSEEEICKAVALFQPDLIICPFLKEKVPVDIYKKTLCVILHPGIKGDRGPSSLDWAIMNREEEWGVTALQAAEEMDGGDIWATATFPIRLASKGSLYRREVTRAAVRVMIETVTRFEGRTFVPEPLDYSNPTVRGILRPSVKQRERAIDWQVDTVATVIQKNSCRRQRTRRARYHRRRRVLSLWRARGERPAGIDTGRDYRPASWRDLPGGRRWSSLDIAS